jgi:hypothetical protein
VNPSLASLPPTIGSRHRATACVKFAESERLDPAGGTLVDLAKCEERLGHLASVGVSVAQAL